MRIAPAFARDIVLSDRIMRRWASGIASLDGALGGGLAYGCIHEIYAVDAKDASAAAGFVLSLANSMSETRQTIVWLRSQPSARGKCVIQANGCMELGAIPENWLFGEFADRVALLRIAMDALRCTALGAVIVECWNGMRELDLTASRRLALAAEKSGIPLFLLRIDATPVPSAGQTRWQVASAPSQSLPGRAPGRPTFDIELVRQRSGPNGLSWRLEWDRDQRIFRDAPLSGPMVSVPVRRPAEARGTEPLFRVERYAA